MEKEYLEKLNKKTAHKTLAEAFETLIELRLGKLAFSTSFGQEDQVITDFIFKNNLPVSVFTLDTELFIFNAPHIVLKLSFRHWRTFI